MLISKKWLDEFVKTELSNDEISQLLTDLGLEVEGVEEFESIKGSLNGLIVAEVMECEKHPNADKLKVTKVNTGSEILQIVCGATNVAKGQKIALATIGTALYPTNGESFEIKKSKIRGEESFGMICAEDEIGLGNSHEGIMVLDSQLKNGTALSEVFEVYKDTVFEIGLTPNRADAMSHLGVARDLLAGLKQQNKSNSKLITPSVSEFKIDKRTLKIDVNVEDKNLAPRYCGITISDVHVKPSPFWLQNRLKAIGLTPINNVVDATNYVLHELGQPLHAFDADKIEGKINVKTVKQNTKFVTLDGVERTLSSDDLMICDDKKPLCIAGVFGGLESGVSETTKNIFLESAYFNPVSIRKTAKRHGLSTDASFRFERGIDPEITDYALKRACLLIQNVAGGIVTTDLIDLYPEKIENHKILVSYEKINKTLGYEIPRETIKNILTSLDVKFNSVSDSSMGIEVPSYRVDVTRDIDVIEEILRVYGFNNIPFGGKVNATLFNTPRTEDYKIQNLVASLLTSQGFFEIMNNSLTDENETKYNNQIDPNKYVKILNPLSQDLSVMRQNLLYGGMQALQFNVNRKSQNLKFFEFGNLYKKADKDYKEQKMLGIWMTGQTFGEHWSQKPQILSFFDIKTVVNTILERFGIKNVITQSTTNEFFSEGLDLYCGVDLIAQYGVVKTKFRKDFDIKHHVFYAEFHWNIVLKHLNENIKVTEISKYPEVNRDLSLLVNNNVSYADIQETVINVNKKLIKKVDLFDVYQDNSINDNNKSYAIRLTLQNDEKTLTDDDIERCIKKVLKELSNQHQVVLR